MGDVWGEWDERERQLDQKMQHEQAAERDELRADMSRYTDGAWFDQNKRLRGDIEDPNEMVQVKRGSITAYQTAIANLQQHLNELEALCILKQKDQQGLAARRDKLAAEVARLKDRLRETEAENERLRDEQRYLHKRAEEIAAERDELRADMSRYTDGAWFDQNRRLRGELDDAAAEASYQAQRANDLYRRLNDMTDQARCLRAENERLRRTPKRRKQEVGTVPVPDVPAEEVERLPSGALPKTCHGETCPHGYPVLSHGDQEVGWEEVCDEH
jgi:chromosome segregation ATPase